MAQDVQGCTDAEAEGDIRLIFTNSPAESQAEVYERLAARDIDALLLMIVMPDIEFSISMPSVIRHLVGVDGSRLLDRRVECGGL